MSLVTQQCGDMRKYWYIRTNIVKPKFMKFVIRNNILMTKSNKSCSSLSWYY